MKKYIIVLRRYFNFHKNLIIKLIFFIIKSKYVYRIKIIQLVSTLRVQKITEIYIKKNVM